MAEKSKRAAARPSPERLALLLRLDVATGRLYWRKRPVSDFAGCADPEREAARFNGRLAGKEALKGAKGARRCVGGVSGFGTSRAPVVWALVHGYWPETTVSHKNGDTRDDRPSNLRLASGGQYARSVRPESLTRVKGVSRSGKRWRARLRVDGRLCSLGCYATRAQAVQAIRKAEIARSAAWASAAPDKSGAVTP